MNLSHPLLAKLNAEQRKAVEKTYGRILILAGAGSGKTSVLAHRIAFLIEVEKAAPDSILGLTFTNKAAEEMRERVSKIVDPKAAKRVNLCTFHSFCMQILREKIEHLGYTSQFSLYDEKDIKRLLTQLARQLLEHEGELPSLEMTWSKICYAKNRGLSMEEWQSEKTLWHDKFTKELFERLHICMRAYNAVDFDSLLTLTEKLLREFPEVLSHYQSQYRYIMIDEYQDTNPIQYRVAKLLSSKHNNLCVVGDDDQSIYGWRGADVKNILEFEADVIIKLEQNYRSTPTILNGANAVISHNQKRHEKKLWSNKEKGDLITLFHAPTEIEEAQAIAERLVWMKKHKNLKWSDMAVLYRSNVLSRGFEMALMQTSWEKEGKWVRGIPYQIVGGTEFYERSEIKDLMAYLKVIVNPLDQEALLRIINIPRRGVSDQALDLLTQKNRQQDIPLWILLQNVRESPHLFPEISDRAKQGVCQFIKLIETAKEKFQPSMLSSALQWFLEEINYKKAIEEDVKSDKMREFKWENVSQYFDVLANYEEEKKKEGKTGRASLQDFLVETILSQEKLPFRKKENFEEKVNLMTFHSAKGLEFSACFLVCLEDHILPHEKSFSDRDVEEERRLMYVAMTRAKHFLTLSMARKRKKMGKEINCKPSRFLFEIPKDLLKITSWQTIE